MRRATLGAALLLGACACGGASSADDAAFPTVAIAPTATPTDAPTPTPPPTPTPTPAPPPTPVPATPAPTFNPDVRPSYPPRVDVCASPSTSSADMVDQPLRNVAATKGARGRGQMRVDHGDGDLDGYVYACGVDTAHDPRYFGRIVTGPQGGCQDTQVYLDLGYLSLLSDNTTEYAHSSLHASRMPAQAWIAIYDAGPNTANRSNPTLIFCGQMTH